MRIGMLGPLTVLADDGTPVAVTGARLRTLLILLALDAGRVVTTARLVDGVWGAEPPAEAANALQALVSRLRRAGLTVESGPVGYRLVIDPDDVDVHRFSRLAADRATLGEALALWRGPALADAATAAFAQAPIARLTELRLTAVADRIADRIEAATDDGVLPELESLVAEHPLRERFAALLMRALGRAGRPAEALAVFARTKAALAEQLGMDPSPELAAAHLAVLRGEAAEPATNPRAEPATNLRAGLTSFVGRDQELAHVAGMVAESRLITLTGPGGSGKTRLATEVGRRLLGSLPDGVWLVELAPVADGGDVPQTALGALGLRANALVGAGPGRMPAPEADPADRLAAALSIRAPLLILDNCEHLVGAVAALVDRLLGECPRLRILATSREPLGITGETLWPVDPLTLPPANADPVEALAFPAPRLLAERARAVRPSFTVDATTAAAMVRVCRALDGMPLAIELAAARLRTMSLDQLATRLDDRFRLLTGGSRLALPRHQTLRAVVDWSWDLLADDERTLLRRLAVFTGGATLEAAERVCSEQDGGDGDGLRAGDVLDLLTALVDKSLVVLDGDRYRMLETIKAYGWERLVEAGEVDRARAAHVAYFARLAAAAEPHLRTAAQLGWLRVLRADHDNLHAAMRSAVAAGDATAARRMLCDVGWYWWLHGHRVEGTELADEVLAMPGEVPDEVRALALATAAMLAAEGMTDPRRALRWFEEAVAVVERVERRHPLLRLVAPLREVLRSFGEPSEAWRLHLSDELFSDEDPWVQGCARVMRAHASVNAGRLHQEAEDDFHRALADFRSLGERWGMSFTLCSLADLLVWQGQFTTAIAHYEEACGLFAELVTNEDLVRYRLRLASLHARVGADAAAAAVLGQAERDAERSGLPEGLAGVAHARAELARLAGDLVEARRQLDRACELAEHVTVAPQFRAVLAGSCGYLAAAVGDLDAAAGHHATAVEHALASNDSPVIAHVLVGLADLALRRGEPHQAALLLGASAGVRGMPDRSLLDHARIAAATRAELGEQAYADAVARGHETTAATVRELTGATLATGHA